MLFLFTGLDGPAQSSVFILNSKAFDAKQICNLPTAPAGIFKAGHHPVRAKPTIDTAGRTKRNSRTSSIREQVKTGFEPTVDVTVKGWSDRLVIKVKDNGTGIPESIKAKIFQPFFTTKPTGKCTGLSLLLSYHIRTQRYGRILRVERQPGEGITFIIELPQLQKTERMPNPLADTHFF